MQNNLRNRSVALASTFALALTGIVATAPAAQAVTPVSLTPSSGTNLGVFITDEFEMDIAIPSGIPATALAIQIDNPDKENLEISFDDATVSEVVLRAFTATGVEKSLATARVDVSDANANYDQDDSGRGNANVVDFTSAGTDRKFKVDFDVDTSADDVTRLVLTGFRSDGSTALDDQSVEIGIRALKANGNSLVYGDGNQGDVTVTAWVDLEETPDPTTIDASTTSGGKTIKFYDPKAVSVIPTIERFVDASGTLEENDTNEQILAGKIRFIRPDLNLDQVDLDKWTMEVLAGGAELNTSTVESADAQRAGTGSVGVDTKGSKAHDTAGAVYFAHDTQGNLQETSLYTVRVKSNGTGARSFTSAGYATPTNDKTRAIFASVTDAVNATQDTSEAPDNGTAGVNDGTVDLRPGTASFTYKARLFTSNSAVREKVASQTVFAVVKAGSFMPAGTELTVTGSSDVLSTAGAATVVSGLTDSEGDFSVTVTSSNPVAATSYTVDFFSVNADDDLIKTTGTSLTGDSSITATYVSAAVTGASALTLASDVLAGTNVTIGATAKDSFGQVTSTSAGKALYVTAQATTVTDLDETVAVGSDGTASISFANYVGSGESDVITVYLHTGATFVSGDEITSKVVSLYNPAGVAAVNAPAAATGVITYDDFITGAASSTNVAPNDGGLDVTGTVVDANGAGIPGAVVTVDADGFQLRKKDSGNYFQDSITFTADAAGRFTVTMWAHTVSTTGVDVTITSGTQTATTTVKTYLPQSLNGGNLVFDMNIPANIDVNKTYAVQASLTDKWGNPVATSGDTVRFLGVGSVTINSSDTAVNKSFGRDGTVTVFLRSVKDIEGPGSVTAELLTGADYTSFASGAVVTNEALGIAEVTTDVVGTAHDETSFSNELSVNVNVGEAAQSSTQKVNAGSFKGYVAVYALGYEGQRLSAKIGNDWVIVDPIVNNESANLARVTDFTGAGVDIAVRIYIDRVLIDTINLTTK